MIAVFLVVPPLAVALAVVIGHLLDGNGDHTWRGVRRAARETARETAAGFLPRAGCLPIDTALLADPWDLTTQLPAPRPDVWDEDEADAGWRGPHAEILDLPGYPDDPDDPCHTGEFAALLARGRWTPAQERDRLAEKYMPAPEETP